MRADKRTVGTAGTANLYRTPWTTLRRRQTSFAVAPRTCHVSRRSRCHRCRHRQPRATSAAVAEAVALSTRSPMPAGQKRKIALQIEKTSRKTKRKTENKPQLVRCGTNNGTQTHTSTHTSTHTRTHRRAHATTFLSLALNSF